MSIGYFFAITLYKVTRPLVLENLNCYMISSPKKEKNPIKLKNLNKHLRKYRSQELKQIS